MLSLKTTATFRSILLPGETGAGGVVADDVLHDLALDQVLERTAAAAPAAADAFRTLCADVDQVVYRQEVFRALEQPEVRAVVDRFLQQVKLADQCDAAAANSHYRYVPELWHLHSVVIYAKTVRAFASELKGSSAATTSVGLAALTEHLVRYCETDAFVDLAAEAEACLDAINALEYNVLVRGGKITVAATDGETDLRDEVLATFARFRSGDVGSTEPTTFDSRMDHVQAWVLEKVAEVHPAAFARLVRFAQASTSYRDATVMRFVGEVWFYLATLDYLAPLRAAGLPVCYPEVSASVKELEVHDTYDLALATAIVANEGTVVRNDLRLTGRERIIVVSGPNQGGKTTTARTFGQLHHLAAIGCPVPGSSARIMLCDQVLSEFEREEQLDDLAGRLGAEIERMHEFLGNATDRTVLVLNEVFSSTALQDARVLTRDVLQRILDLDALAVCVTFIDELSRMDERTVSMVSSIDPHNPAVRTFRVERRVADGRAYARALAAVHGLTAEQIEQRMNGDAGSSPDVGAAGKGPER